MKIIKKNIAHQFGFKEVKEFASSHIQFVVTF